MNGGGHDYDDLLADYTQTPSAASLPDLDDEEHIISYLPDLDAEFTSTFTLQTSATRRRTLDPILDLKSELARLRLANQISQHDLQSLWKAIRSGFVKFDSFFEVSVGDREEDDQRLAPELVATSLVNLATQANALHLRSSILHRLLVCRNDRFFALQDYRRKWMAFAIWRTRFGSQRLMVSCVDAIEHYQSKTEKSLFFYRWFLQKLGAKFRQNLEHIAICFHQFRRRHLNKILLIKWRLTCDKSRRQLELRKKDVIVRIWIRWIRLYANRWRERYDQLQVAHRELVVEYRAQQRFQSLSSCFHAWRSFSCDRKQLRSLQELKRRRLLALSFWRWMGALDRFRSTRLNHCIDCGSVLRTVAHRDSSSVQSADVQTDEVQFVAESVRPAMNSVDVQTDYVPYRQFADFCLPSLSVDPVERIPRGSQSEAIPARDANLQTADVERTDSQSQTNNDDASNDKIRRLERTIAMLRDQRDRERAAGSASLGSGNHSATESDFQAQVSQANVRCAALERQNSEFTAALSSKDDEIAELQRKLSECVDKCSSLERAARESSDGLHSRSLITSSEFSVDSEANANDAVVNYNAASESSALSAKEKECSELRHQLSDMFDRYSNLQEQLASSKSAAFSANEEEISELQRQLEEANYRCSNLQRQQESGTSSYSSHSAELSAKEVECAELRRQLSEAHAECLSLQQQLQNASASAASKDKECSDLRRQLSEPLQRCSSLQQQPAAPSSLHDSLEDAPLPPSSVTSKDQEIVELRRQLSQAAVMCSKLRQIVCSLSKKSESPLSKPHKRSRTDPDIHLSDLAEIVSGPESSSKPAATSTKSPLSSKSQDSRATSPVKVVSDPDSALAKSASDGGQSGQHLPLSPRMSKSSHGDDSFKRILALCTKLAAKLQIELPAMSGISSHAAICESIEQAVARSDDVRPNSRLSLSSRNRRTADVSLQTTMLCCSCSENVSLIDPSNPSPTDLKQMQILVSDYPDLFGSCNSLLEFCGRVRELLRSSLETNRESSFKYHDLIRRLRVIQSDHVSILGSFSEVADICNSIREALSRFRRLQQDVVVWEDCLLNRFGVRISISPAVPSEVLKTIESFKTSLTAAAPERFSIAIGTDDVDVNILFQLSSILNETCDWHQIESLLDSPSASPRFLIQLRGLIESSAGAAVCAFRSRVSTFSRLRCFRHWAQLYRLRSKAKQFLSRCDAANHHRIAAKLFLRSLKALALHHRAAETAGSQLFLKRVFLSWARLSSFVRRANHLQIRSQMLLLKSSFTQWRSICFVRVRQRLVSQPANRGSSASSSFEVIRHSTIISEVQPLSNSTLMELPAAVLSPPELTTPIVNRSSSLDSQVDQDFRLFAMLHDRLKKRAVRAKYWYKWRFAAHASEVSQHRPETTSMNDSSHHLPEIVEYLIWRFSMPKLKLAKAFLHWRCLFLQSRLHHLQSRMLQQPAALTPSSQIDDQTDRIVEFISDRAGRVQIASLLARTFLHWRFATLARRRRQMSQPQPISIHSSSSIKAAVFHMWRNRCLTSWLFEAQQLDVARSAVYQRHVTFIIWRMTARWRQSQLLAISHFRRNVKLKLMRRIFSAWTAAYLSSSRRRFCLSRSLRLIRLLHIRKAWRNWSTLPRRHHHFSQELLINSLLQKVRQLRRQIELKAIASDVRTVDPVKIFCQSVLS